MSEQYVVKSVQAEEPIQPTAARTEDTPEVVLRPNLNRDIAGFMTLLFIIIAYHIQHPTLLLRAQFGRSFRGESLQEAVSIALIFSGAFLLFSGPKFWQKRHEPASRLDMALVVGLALFAFYFFIFIWQDTNLVFDLYGLDAETLADEFREEAFVNPVKTLNITAVFTGAALASVVLLWSPWDYKRQRFWLQTGAAAVALIMVFAGYIAQHPIFSERIRFSGPVVSLLLLASVVGLVEPWNQSREKLLGNGKKSFERLRLAVALVLMLYVLHVLAVVGADYNFFASYYDVKTSTFTELLGGDAQNKPLWAFDLAAMLAGVALISAVYLMAPWERLGLYLTVIRGNIAPILVAITTIIVWEQAIHIFEIEEFLLPKPTVIWNTFKEEYPKLVAAGWFTFQNALFGFLVGCGLGIFTGIISARFTQFSRGILPLAIAANSVPIIAFAPIANFWFGVTSANSKVAIVAVLCYFPAMISTVRGLTSVEPIQLELMRSYAATELEIFGALRLPNALPFVFSALKLATTLAMIGAIVAEFFGGSLAGLGYRIREDAALFRFPESWSAILVASFFGIGFYMLVSSLERAAMPWYRSFRSDSH